MKKLISGLVIGGILGSCLFASAEGPSSWLAQKATFKVMVRGEEFVPVNPPIVVEGRTYLPLRSLGEALGVDVEWNADLKQAEVGMAKNPVTEIAPVVNAEQEVSTVTSWTAYRATFKVMVRGEDFVSENPPIVVEGRTYLPLRAMGDALGVKVDWNAELKQAEVGETVVATPTATATSAVTATPAPATTPKPTLAISKADTINFDMSSVEVKAGEEVSIPITISNIASIGISTFDFEVLYDAENLEYVGVTPGDILKNAATNFASNLEEEGKIRFLYLDYTMKDEAINTNGVLATIKLKVKDTAKVGEYPVEVPANYTFGDPVLADMKVEIKSGAVTVAQ